MQWRRYEKDRQFGTELSKNILDNQTNVNHINKNKRKRTFKQIDEGSKKNSNAFMEYAAFEQPAKRFRYNLRSRTDLNVAKENKETKKKMMDIDSDDSCDEDIDIVQIKSNKQRVEIKEKETKIVIKRKTRGRGNKRKQKKEFKKPIRRSLRLRNKRKQNLKKKQEKKGKIWRKKGRKTVKKQIIEIPLEPSYVLEPSLSECDLNVSSNDAFVTEYVADIMSFYSSAEEISLSNIRNNYISSTFQPDLNENMRCILLNWLFNVHRRFKLSERTLFLGVYMFDTFLSSAKIKRDQLQLIGCACMWIASKYHEIYAPEANDFAYMSDYSFSVDDLFEMELKILCKLQFKFSNMISPLNFTERYLQIATYPLYKKYQSRGTVKALKDGNKYIDLVKNLTNYFIELSLLDCKLVSTVKPSKIAAASLCFTVISISLYSKWPEFLQNATNYNVSQLKPILKELNKMRIIANKKYPSVKKKHPSICKWLDRLNIDAVTNLQ